MIVLFKGGDFIQSYTSKVPLFCGIHEKTRLIKRQCPKCGRDADEFMLPNHAIPFRLAVLTIVLFIIGIILIPVTPIILFSSGGIFGKISVITCCIGAIAGGVAGFYNLRTIQEVGYVACSKCGNSQSPDNTWCIFCSEYIKWWTIQRPQPPIKDQQSYSSTSVQSYDPFYSEFEENVPQQKFCSTCGLSLTFNQQYNQYFCNTCQKYE